MGITVKGCGTVSEFYFPKAERANPCDAIRSHPLLRSFAVLASPSALAVIFDPHVHPAQPFILASHDPPSARSRRILITLLFYLDWSHKALPSVKCEEHGSEAIHGGGFSQDSEGVKERTEEKNVGGTMGEDHALNGWM